MLKFISFYALFVFSFMLPDFAFSQFAKDLDYKPLDLSGIKTYSNNANDINSSLSAQVQELRIMENEIFTMVKKLRNDCPYIPDNISNGVYNIMYTNTDYLFGDGIVEVLDNKIFRLEFKDLTIESINDVNTVIKGLGQVSVKLVNSVGPKFFEIYFIDFLQPCDESNVISQEYRNILSEANDAIISKEYNLAGSLYNEAYSQYDNSEDLYNSAVCYYVSSDLDKAEKQFLLLETEDPTHLDGMYYLAQLYNMAGHIDKYQSQLIKIKDSPYLSKLTLTDKATIYNNIAYNFISYKEYGRASYFIEKSLQLNDSHAYSWDTFGELKFWEGNFEECIANMSTALSKDKSDNSYLYRGLAYLALNNYELGCIDLNYAKELGNVNAKKHYNENCK